MRAWWEAARNNQRRASIAGTETNLKTLKDTYAAEANAHAEMDRMVRGKATLTINLATDQPLLAVKISVRVQGYEPEIDGKGWLIKTEDGELSGDGGFTTKIEMERGGEGDAPTRTTAADDMVGDAYGD